MFLEIFQPSFQNDGDSLDVTLSESMLRRIAIHPTERDVSLKGEHPNLRSLLLFQDEKLIDLHISECKNFKFLRVLKVVKKKVKKWHVSSAIGNLLHLRYLRLQSFEDQIILPRSIGKLKSLHSLHVQCDDGSTIIPNILFKLERLRHVLVFGRSSNLCLPSRFSSKSIETLKCIDVDKLIENKAVLNLPNIRNLGIRLKRSKDVEPILKELLESHRLGSLEMWFLEDSVPYPDLEPLSQCHHLSQLFLKGKIREDPMHSRLQYHALKFLPANIVELTLWFSSMKQDPMVVLEKLPHLRILSLLWESYKGKNMKCSANGFLQLDSLEFEHLPELEEWEIEEGAMPRLRSLCLDVVPKLRKFSEGLRYVTFLQEMKLIGMQSSLLERIEVIDGIEGDDFYKVSHIPYIQFD